MDMSAGWKTEATSPDEVHVVPYNDTVKHHLHIECICGPTTEPIARDDGTYGWLYTHHSLDGREGDE